MIALEIPSRLHSTQNQKILETSPPPCPTFSKRKVGSRSINFPKIHNSGNTDQDWEHIFFSLPPVLFHTHRDVSNVSFNLSHICHTASGKTVDKISNMPGWWVVLGGRLWHSLPYHSQLTHNQEIIWKSPPLEESNQWAMTGSALLSRYTFPGKLVGGRVAGKEERWGVGSSKTVSALSDCCMGEEVLSPLEPTGWGCGYISSFPNALQNASSQSQ